MNSMNKPFVTNLATVFRLLKKFVASDEHSYTLSQAILKFSTFDKIILP